MGTVVWLRQRHSVGLGRRASASNVISRTPRRVAIATIAGQRPGGIPRVFQLLMTGGSTERSVANPPVPPSMSITQSGVISNVMKPTLFTFCEDVKNHETAIEAGARLRHASAMATRYKDIGNRLVSLREALGIKAVDLCKEIGCKQNRWSQYESGERQITLAIANRLTDEYGVTLDWIYRGDRTALPQHLHAKLPRAA